MHNSILFFHCALIKHSQFCKHTAHAQSKPTICQLKQSQSWMFLIHTDTFRNHQLFSGYSILVSDFPSCSYCVQFCIIIGHNRLSSHLQAGPITPVYKLTDRTEPDICFIYCLCFVSYRLNIIIKLSGSPNKLSNTLINIK